MQEFSCPHCNGKFKMGIIGSEKRKKMKTMANPDVPVLLKYFYDKWKEKFNKVYLANFPVEGRIAKDLLKVYPLEQLKEFIDKFLMMEDEFCKLQGYKLTLFRTQINAIATRKETANERRRRIEGIHKQFGLKQ
jgi:hypothetical protein